MAKKMAGALTLKLKKALESAEFTEKPSMVLCNMHKVSRYRGTGACLMGFVCMQVGRHERKRSDLCTAPV